MKTTKAFRAWAGALLLVGVGTAWVGAAAPLQPAQEPNAPAAVAPEQLQAAIDKLGDLDYPTRTAAARTVRRTPNSQAAPALLRAVDEHKDGYVRYRALVLLTGFNDPRTGDAMREALSSPNDRLRTVAYSYFERNPDPDVTQRLVGGVDKEQAEFVRPALVRALASAARTNAKAQQVLVTDVGRGEDFFRGAVIEALGDYKAQYAVPAILAVAKLDGPLQDDAVLALGKIGDKSTLETMAALQRSAPRNRQPSIASAICLLGVNCESHESFTIETLKFTDTNPGFQELLRNAAFGLGALGVSGRATAVEALFAVGIPSQDPTRAPVALAVATVALRNTQLMMSTLATHPRRDEALSLLAEGFDMLEEDLEKERFFAFVRRSYWESGDGSPSRALLQSVIGKLDF
jgi:HEAT repeat protein